MAIKLPFNITRGQVDKVFTLVLMVNSVVAVFSLVAFFLSSWWLWASIATIGFPVLLGGFLLYRYTSFREPIQKYVFRYIVKTYEAFVQKRAFLIKKIYTIICWFIPSDEWKQITWGYATFKPNGDLIANQEGLEAEKKWYAQLYHYLATGFGNWTSLEGKSVLEIRSGGGGGLEYISKSLNPQKAVGIDVSGTQTKYNEQNNGQDSLKFLKADNLEQFSKAEGLGTEKFDIVLSVQSSQYIDNFKNFIQEVDKVTRPGGIFAFTDLRSTGDWAELEKQLESSSLKILKKENISKNVIQALKLNELERFRMINKRFGSILKSIMHRIGIIKNNAVSETLSKGTAEAHAYLLHKAPQKLIET